MFSQSGKISHGLVLLSLVLLFHYTNGRSVRPVTFGYELGTPLDDVFSAVPEQVDDLSISAAEPRPVYVELVQRPLSLPLVADAGIVSAVNPAPVISASEKIEKILRRPMAFSFNNDQANAASDVVHAPKEKLEVAETRHSVDQQPDAVDYYKYIARLQDEGKEGSLVQKENSELKKKEESKEEVAEEKKDKADLRSASKPNIFLNYSPSNFYKEYARKPSLDFHKSEEHASKQKAEEKKDGDHEGHADQHHYHHHEAQPADIGGKAEATESHEEHKHESHQSGHQSGSEESHKEEVQASASDHGGGGGGGGGHGGGGGGGNYKKGGGREFQTVNEGEHGEIGEKKYSGAHHHEKGEKGHKDKDDHLDEYKENIGHKKGNHEEDGYESEHQHGEDGKRGTEFHEEGEHSKGHSTQGEHNIHKKDEYEKKQEFYDESHEGGEHEKHGEYFHEDDYNKGGHHKSDHHKGGAHEEHYGEKKKFDEGGHEHEDSGHKKAIGREVHHDHQGKEGEESKHQGGKKWQYQHGASKGDDDSKGAHQTVQVVVKDGKAEASDNGKAAEAPEKGKAQDSKGSHYHVIEIITEKRSEGVDRTGDLGDEAQATEHHDDQTHEAYDFGGLDIGRGHGDGNERSAASHQYPNHDAGVEQNARPKEEGGDAQATKLQGYGDTSYGYLYGAAASPQRAEQPHKAEPNNYAADSVAYHVHSDKPLESHVHEDGQICTGSHAEEAESAYVPQLAKPADSSEESHGQGEESAPNSHIIVVGSDGNIYGVLRNGDLVPGVVAS